jgi:hypothetical protein
MAGLIVSDPSRLCYIVPMDGTVTQLPHRRFTSHDVARMVEAGLIDPDERIELIDGEIIDMGSEGGGALERSREARELASSAFAGVHYARPGWTSSFVR